MITAKIGRRGQFTLPREIRRAMGLKEGDRRAGFRGHPQGSACRSGRKEDERI